MATTFKFIAKAAVTSAALYTVVSQAPRLKKVEVEVDNLTRCKVNITWRKSGTIDGDGPVFGTATVTSTTGSIPTPSDFLTQLSKALNDIDSPFINGNDKKITIVPDLTPSTSNNPEDANKFEVTMKNLKPTPLFAELFQGFEVEGGNPHAVAWRIALNSISGPDQSSSVTWEIQYAWVWGTSPVAGQFALTAFKPCNLGDKATLSYNVDQGRPVLQSTTPSQPDGTLAVTVDSNFPDGYYVGFGIIGEDSNCHPVGVIDASSGMMSTFTPKTDYSVAFVTDTEDMGLYTVASVSQFQNFSFTGTNFNHATCTFNDNGTWTVAYSSDAGAASEDDDQNSSKASNAHVNFLLPSVNRVKTFTVDYYRY